MRVTSFTDYGFRMLMCMASQPGRAVSTAEMARLFGLSRHHLAKIMQKLAAGGVVVTKRGGGGGARLAHAPENIRLGDVARVLGEGRALVDCLSNAGSDCTLVGQCRLQSRLRAAEEAFLADLDRSTLADIALAQPAKLEGAS